MCECSRVKLGSQADCACALTQSAAVLVTSLATKVVCWWINYVNLEQFHWFSVRSFLVRRVDDVTGFPDMYNMTGFFACKQVKAVIKKCVSAIN